MLRAAGSVWKSVPKIAKWLTKNSTKDELVMRLGMDGLMGAAIGMQQPGDLGDKLIAGITDASLGSVGVWRWGVWAVRALWPQHIRHGRKPWWRLCLHACLGKPTAH